ncbi:MAG TPA: DUF4446 family protein [Acidimicrobiia bacterium]|nr:DUF4446 family protein [Acidimicrobiia bacterium]
MTAAVAVVALVVALAFGIQVVRLSRKLRAVPDGGIYEGLQRLDEDLATAEAAIATLQPIVASVERRMPGAIRHTAVVAYDAYGNQAGHLSRSVAMLNEQGDGLVLSLLVGRDETRFFTKMVEDGRGLEPLSPEEVEAITRALGR